MPQGLKYIKLWCPSPSFLPHLVPCMQRPRGHVCRHPCLHQLKEEAAPKCHHSTFTATSRPRGLKQWGIRCRAPLSTGPEAVSLYWLSRHASQSNLSQPLHNSTALSTSCAGFPIAPLSKIQKQCLAMTQHTRLWESPLSAAAALQNTGKTNKDLPPLFHFLAIYPPWLCLPWAPGSNSQPSVLSLGKLRRTHRVAQEVEHLSSKCEAMSSNTNVVCFNYLVFSLG
jgi:hypothetical protein